MDLKEFCKELEIDYEKNLLKFGNNNILYTRFLKKFLEDKTYIELETAFREKDYNKIEQAAHTLKGVTANLGINRLFKASEELVLSVRKKEYDNLDETYQKLKQEYEETKEMINKLN